MLRKGILKYPKGTSRRWEVISEYIGTGQTVEEILKATKTVLLQKPDSSKAFDSFLEKRKPAQSIASPLTTRVESEGLPVTAPQENSSSSSSSEATIKQSSTSSSDETSQNSNGIPLGAEQDAWSATQERALIQALKTFPKEAAQRCERVVAAVPGKNCHSMQKEICGHEGELPEQEKC